MHQPAGQVEKISDHPTRSFLASKALLSEDILYLNKAYERESVPCSYYIPFY